MDSLFRGSLFSSVSSIWKNASDYLEDQDSSTDPGGKNCLLWKSYLVNIKKLI